MSVSQLKQVAELKKRSKEKNKGDILGHMHDINVTLEDVKSYLQEKKYLLLKDKNKFTAETLMMLLDNDKLAALEDEFNEHPNGIEMSNFVWLMKCAIVHSQEDKHELINGLIKLFDDIDINGDHQMQWSEFTQYIIDAVIGEKDSKFFDARSERERELTENEIFDRAYSKRTKRYLPCKYFDNSTHQNHVSKAIYSPHVNALFCLEQNSPRLKLYTVDCKELEIGKRRLFLQPPVEEKQIPFILDFTIAEDLNTIVATTSDRQLFFWDNNLTNRPTKSFKLDVLQSGIWYLPVHKLWISAGADYNIRTWKFDDFEDQDKIKADKFMLAHLKIITQIEELISPRLIASGSLDGHIKLWDLTDPSNPPILVTELRDPNQDTRGILGLSYSGHYGSNLLSYGFELHINVWCPEISITRAFIGKLEGHSSLVQICKFMDTSPNVISIDEKCSVRIWDIRTMNTIQVVNSEGSFMMIYDVAVIGGKHDMFVLTGKRLAYYENAMQMESAKSVKEEIYPLAVDFNSYFNYICVLTKNDLRVYDAMDGKLKKVFNELLDEKQPVDLSMFSFASRQRKFFVADNVGLIRQYNMKSGEFIKNVNALNETESSEFTKKQQNVKRKDNNQISQIIYVPEEKLLIASYFDSTVRIYDETDSQESVLLKVMTGGHKDSEITTLAYSEKFSLIATGSANGRIALWEFESGKLENILIAREKGEITCLAFGDPYPVILSSGTGGVLNVWGLKGCPPAFRYKNIGRFVNSHWMDDGTFQKVSITSVLCEVSIQEGVPFTFVIDKAAPSQRSSFDPVMRDEKREDLGKKKKDAFNFNQSVVIQSTLLTSGITMSNNFVTQQGETGGQSLSPTARDGESNEVNGKLNESFSDFSGYQEIYRQRLSLKQRRFYVILGDMKGMIQLLNLTEFLQNRNILPLREEKKRKYFQLRRKDFINAQKFVDTILSAPDRRSEKLPPYIHFYNSILINRWEAHSGLINYLLRIPDPLCYASCSQDKTVKIWSLKSECFGKVKFYH